MNPLISVVIPVYNTESYVRKAIGSVLKQTYDNVEIICVDDGSTDNSPRILDEFAANYNNIKVIHTQNKGLSHARNTALDCCKGEYIAFLDSDDMYHEQMLKILYDAVIEGDCDIATCNVVNYSDNDVDRLRYELPEHYDVSVHRGEELMEYFYSLDKEKVQKAVLVCVKLYKRKIWDDIRYPVGRIYEDNAVLHMIAQKTDKFADVPLGIYYRYLREDSIMGQSKKFSIKNFDILYNQKERCDYYEKGNNPTFTRLAYKEYLHTLRCIYTETKESSLNVKDICPKIKEEYRTYFGKVKKLKVYSKYDVLKETAAGLLKFK